VIEHFDRQLAAGVPVIDLPEEDKPPELRKVIPFDSSRGREKP
jgi:hypothetical protein